MARRTKNANPSATHRAQSCAVTGCKSPAEHKAPKSRRLLRDYQWLCLYHVREFNKAWDYFSGMNREEIEAFAKDAVTGHRPTWRLGELSGKPHSLLLEEALAELLGQKPPQQRKPAISRKLQKALDVLGLAYPVTQAEMKKRYKSLVKKHHPDVNRGDKTSEELFKQITEAYQYVIKTFEKNI